MSVTNMLESIPNGPLRAVATGFVDACRIPETLLFPLVSPKLTWNIAKCMITNLNVFLAIDALTNWIWLPLWSFFVGSTEFGFAAKFGYVWFVHVVGFLCSA